MEESLDTRANRLPPQIAYIVTTEACERFSYYGLASILTLYIANRLQLGQSTATGIVHLFKFGVYFLPLLGAWVADRYLGRYHTILYISLLYCLGHLVMALGEGTLWGLYAALGLIALGAGGIKPCVSAFVGDQIPVDRPGLLQKAFGAFYWSVNFGSVFSFLVIPWTHENYGYAVAFGIPGIFMALAALTFRAGRTRYVMLPPAPVRARSGFLPVLWDALGRALLRRSFRNFWRSPLGRFNGEELDAARRLFAILCVFSVLPVFWALFDQTSTTWVLQGARMAPYHLFAGSCLELKIGAEQMQSCNPIMIMILLPLFTAFAYPGAARLGIIPTPLRRIATGFVLTSVSFWVTGFMQQAMDAGQQFSVIWQLVPYVILTVAEILVSVTGLEFAFSQAPAHLKSTVMSFWLIMIAMGNLFVSRIALLNVKGRGVDGAEILYFNAAELFFLYAFLAAFVSVVFIVIASRYRERAAAG